MSSPTERTRLIPDVNAPHVFDSSIPRERKLRVRQFQCCLCAIFLSILLVTLVMTVLYSINNLEVPFDNSTTINQTTDTQVLPFATLLALLSRTWPISDEKKRNQTCSTTEWLDAMKAGKKALDNKDKIEKGLPNLPMPSPSYRHQKVVATSERGRNLSRIGFIEEYATRYLYRNRKNNTIVEKICHPDNSLPEFCRRGQKECNTFQKYRMYNGSCNNLKHPEDFGVSYRPFRRSIPPNYADGISQPRTAKGGKSLPSARTVSLEVHRPYYRDDDKFSVMLAVWGQFLDHDITATALSKKSGGDSISCCGNSPVTSPECFPVELDPLDPFREYNLTCMEFVRSAPAPTCCLGPREQLNQVTAYIDGSVIYSADSTMVDKLRTMTGGNLKMYITEDKRALLPISEDVNDGCNRADQEEDELYCFLAGDARANENLHLTSMHLLWARHHNLVASNLSQLNPHWNDETVFQEARRILAAQMQHITYNEFLPILLGEKLMEKFELSPKRNGYFHKYNDSIDPTIANNFATAAFRFAHSIIPGLMKLLANDTSSPEYIQMHKMLFNPFQLYKPGGLDSTLKGAMNTTIEASDSYFSDELKSHLFEKSVEQAKEPQLCGLDLVSLNIQRGRDHGLNGYSFWRQHCGLKRPKSFDDLKHDMDMASLQNIRGIYRNIDDIDLYTGALSENPIEGSILGPTITCLILDQFIRLKHGDRFWYENPQKPQAFTPEQLDEIRKTSLAHIICDNADNLDQIQPKVMERLNSKNNYVPCSQIHRTNLTFWKQELDHLNMAGDSIKVLAIETH